MRFRIPPSKTLLIPLALLAVAVLPAHRHVAAGDLQYDYNASADTAGNNTWEDELGTSPGRNWTFRPNAATNPVPVSSAGTILTDAYYFGGGGGTDPEGADAATFDGSALDVSPFPVAFEFWLIPDAATTNRVIFETGGNTRGASVLLEGTTLKFAAIGSSSGAGTAHQAVFDLGTTPSDFTQVVGAVDDAGNQTRLYVNGRLVGAVNGTNRWDLGTDGAGLAQIDGNGAGIGGLDSTDETAFISGGAGGSDVTFDGRIARARFYSGDTSAGDVYQQFRELAPSQADPYADMILSDNPIAYYRLNEPAGTTTAANMGSIGSAVKGTDTTSGGTITRGQPGLVPGSDTAVDLDPTGGGSFIAIPNHGQMNTSSSDYDEKTIELWFNAGTVPSGTAAADADVIYEQGGATNGLNVFLRDGKVGVGAWAGSNVNFIESDETINAGQTYHVVLTYDNLGNVMYGYLNGGYFGGDTSGIVAIPAHSGAIAIGAIDNDSRVPGGSITGSDSNHFDGTVDELALYNNAISQEQVQRHYLTGGGDLGLTPDALLGITLNYDASVAQSAVSDTEWRDTITSGNNHDWALASGAQRVGSLSGGGGGQDVSVHPGITDAYLFDGSGGGTMNSLDTVAADPTDNSATFEVWIKPDNFNDDDVIFETGGGTDGLSLVLDNSIVRFRAKDDARNSQVAFDLNQLPADQLQDFIQIVGVVDLNKDLTQLYVNGWAPAEAGLNGGTAVFDDWAGSDGSGLGRVNGAINFGGYGAYEGQIALFRFYERPFRLGDVRQNYFAVTGLVVPEPATWALLLAGGLVLAAAGRRRRSARP